MPRFAVCSVIVDIVWVVVGCGCYGVLGAVLGHSHVKPNLDFVGLSCGLVGVFTRFVYNLLR